MSETKRMKEPWRVQTRLGLLPDILAENGALVAVAADEEATRIVACVNACAGMTEPAAELAALRAERDKLRKALEFAAKAYDAPRSPFAWAGGGHFGRRKKAKTMTSKRPIMELEDEIRRLRAERDELRRALATIDFREVPPEGVPWVIHWPVAVARAAFKKRL
jgi:hypothetical protein